MDFDLEVEVQSELERLPLFSMGHSCRGDVGVGVCDVFLTTNNGGMLGGSDFVGGLRRRHDTAVVAVFGVIAWQKGLLYEQSGVWEI